jgi:hypothetical protein
MGSGGMAPQFFTSALDRGEWSASPSCCFTSQETDPGIHWIGGWVGLRAGLDVIEKRKHFLSLPGIEPQEVQPVARRYTD